MDNKKYSAKIYLRCDQNIGIGQPKLVYNESCSYNFFWPTTYACPPFEDVDCATMDENMEIFDFSSLILSNSNYQIPIGIIYILRKHLYSTKLNLTT